ncbi:MAG: riboflavin transporter [Bacillota bacterium]|nr:riboflavin transporter [Bacillota bacterium]MDK2855191.1 riboflavin transporter [Bacillota bacterium]MDK2926206.1 riboflavin transporter [Bacillota bacterium]
MARLRDTRYLVKVALLGALGFLLMYLEFPLPFMPSFLKFDFGDVPALIAGFAFGPLAGILAEAIKCALFLLSGRSEAGIIGVSANFVTGASLVVAAALVYQRVRTLKGAILALFVGTIVMTATITVADIYIFLPLWNVPVEQILPMAVSAIIPFNLIKGVLSSTATFLLYKRVSAWLGAVAVVTQPAKARP